MTSRIVLLLVGICASVEAQPSLQPETDWKTVLNWLPSDTKTLIVAPHPFRIPAPAPDDDDSVGSPVDGLREYALGRLTSFPPVYEPLVGRAVSFAVAGVGDFHPRSGIGLMPYDGCALIAFAEAIPPSFAELLASLSTENQF